MPLGITSRHTAARNKQVGLAGHNGGAMRASRDSPSAPGEALEGHSPENKKDGGQYPTAWTGFLSMGIGTWPASLTGVAPVQRASQHRRSETSRAQRNWAAEMIPPALSGRKRLAGSQRELIQPRAHLLTIGPAPRSTVVTAASSTLIGALRDRMEMPRRRWRSSARPG